MIMKMYKVYRYYGGEYPQDVTWSCTYEGAELLGSVAEHFEIEEVKLKRYTNETIQKIQKMYETQAIPRRKGAQITLSNMYGCR